MIKVELNKGLTQRELAQKIGFSHGTIQIILFTDTNFSYKTRKKVADYFRIPVSQFYDDIGVTESVRVELSKPAQPLQDALLLEMHKTLNSLRDTMDRLQGDIIKHGHEMGRMKENMKAAAKHGDIKLLDIWEDMDPKRIN